MKGKIKIRYLVVGSGGPGFASPEEAEKVLANIILPSFDQLINLFLNNMLFFFIINPDFLL